MKATELVCGFGNTHEPPSHKSPRYLFMMTTFWILAALVALYLLIRFSMAWIFPKDT
jgi:hypothetical protein